MVAPHKRKKAGRRPLPKDLPRIQVIHDLSEEDKKCPCGCMLTKIGFESSEQLDIIPAKAQVIEHVKYKYACKSCEDTIKTASMPKQPIPKSIATPGLLAHVLVSKYKEHLPLYRQEQIFQRMKVDIARNTLSHWVIKCGELLLPLYELLSRIWSTMR
jgi:transposase